MLLDDYCIMKYKLLIIEGSLIIYITQCCF